MRRFLLIGALLLCSLSHAAEVGYPRLMQGPMVGAVTESTMLVWVRASGAFACRIEYADNDAFTNAQQSETVTAEKQRDYCITFTLGNLQPGTRYFYRVYVHEDIAHGKGNAPVFSARTAPAAGSGGRFRVAFGSCARWVEDPVQPIWPVVEHLLPDLFFWVGDNIYGDALDTDILAEEYGRQREVPGLQPLLRGVPQLATWDDHDYALNNSDQTNPVKGEALEVFKQWWPNPSFGLDDTPGVFFKYSYGGVDFFFLDGRYHRSPNTEPDGPEKTHLGAAQLAWLKEGLKSSTAPFKVLISGSGWNSGKGPMGDAWSAFLHERNALFDFIRDEAISGVLLLSGDTHVAELNAIPWSESGGYDLYELVSSPLAQMPEPDNQNRVAEMRVRPVFAAAANAGVIDFNLSAQPATVTLNAISQYGLWAWKPVTISAAELVNGKVSAKEKQDAAAREMDRTAKRRAR